MEDFIGFKLFKQYLNSIKFYKFFIINHIYFNSNIIMYIYILLECMLFNITDY